MRNVITRSLIIDWTQDVAERLDTCAGIIECVVLAGGVVRPASLTTLDRTAARLRGVAAAARSPVGGEERFVVDVRPAFAVLQGRMDAGLRVWRCTDPEAQADLLAVAEELAVMDDEATRLAAALPTLAAVMDGAA